MPVANVAQKMGLDTIVIHRDQRQRRVIERPDDLIGSIEKVGLLNPIIIRREDKSLVAGERRLTAYKFLREKHAGGEREKDFNAIPYRYFDELDHKESFLVELAENIIRKALPWQDECLAVAKFHEMLLADNPKQTAEQTASELNVSASYMSRILCVADYLKDGDKLVQEADTLIAAYNVTRRKAERAGDNALNMLLSTGADLTNLAQDKLTPTTAPNVQTDQSTIPGTPRAVDTVPTGTHETPSTHAPTSQVSYTPTGEKPAQPATPSKPVVTGPLPLESAVQLADFTEWVKTYQGQPFDVLHCDFPYGINHQKSGQGNAESFGAYDDSPEVYWNLLDVYFENINKLMFPSAHMIFWFSMKYFRETMARFESEQAKSLGLVVNPIPLIWHKTDNRGIVSDVNRSPRNIYESALFISRGDRKIIQTVGNVYGCATVKQAHTSVKPVAMLQHFFRMVVDKSSRVLDPTSGSGSAIRAAESLGALHAVGLEREEKFVEQSRRDLSIFRTIGFTAD